jgi:WD40 repeat protein
VAALVEEGVMGMALTRAKLGVVLLLAASMGIAGEVGRTQPAEKQPQRSDLFGDPLPQGALARMGSLRWRHVDDLRQWLQVVPSPTGNLVATMSFGELRGGVVRVWDLSDGRQLCEFPWEETLSGRDMHFTPDGSRLMILVPRGVVQFRDPQTGEVLAQSKPVVAKDDVQLESSTHRYSNTTHKLTAEGRWIVTNDHGKLYLTEVSTDRAPMPRQVQLDPPPGTFNRWCSNLFTYDGKTLVAGSHDRGPVILRWDVKTGKLIRRTRLRSSTDPSDDELTHFTQDGKRVVTVQRKTPGPDVVRVWDTETGGAIATLEDAGNWGYGMSESPDGKHLIYGVGERQGNEVTVRATVWELERGKAIARVKMPEWCNLFFLLPDGKTILAAGRDGKMFGTWDMATGRRLSPVPGHESDLRHLAFTADGKTLVMASRDPQERITAWDATTGKKLQDLAATRGPPRYGIIYVTPSAPFALTPGGAVVSTGKGTLTWTDLKTGRELRRVAARPIALALAANDDLIREETLALIHDPHTGRPAVVGVHSLGPPLDLTSPRKHDWQEVVTLWDAESGELLAHRTYPLNIFDDTGVVSPDGRLLARQCHDSTTERTGKSVLLDSALSGRGLFKLKQPDDPAPCYFFTPDGQTLITATSKRTPEKAEGRRVVTSTIHLWEVRSGKQRLEFTLPLGTLPLAASLDGRFLAGAQTDNTTIYVWDLGTGTEVAKWSGYRAIVRTLAFRPDSKALASGHTDGTALVWDLSGLPGVVPAATDREAAWKELASADAGKAYRAIVSLAADPGCVAFLRERVKPVPAVAASEVQKLVNDLDNDEFTRREAASKALEKLGDVAEVELRTLHSKGLSAEQRRRVDEVLAKRELIESDLDRLRALRGVEVLERVGSGDARAVLGELARGAVGARLTGEAGGAVRRINARLRQAADERK